MTKEKYTESHIYIGKHEPKQYEVWRVLGPAGPQERFVVHSLDQAKEAIKGCWDWEVTCLNTNEIVL